MYVKKKISLAEGKGRERSIEGENRDKKRK